MSWISMLCEVYDNCISEIGKKSPNGSMLFPIAHSTAEAQIEIHIDREGNFISAHRVEKGDATTLIPVTEDSASRGNGNFPMPLCDKLCYIAGDYDEYIKPKKSMRAYYEKYMEGLETWSEDKSPSDIKAIYQYLKKEQVMSDLHKEDVFQKESDFVRFVVVGSLAEDAEITVTKKTWESEEVIESFIDHYVPTLLDNGLDYVTGKEMALTNKLPSKIRHTGDKAKLISSNDTNGFTYRGRFLEAGQAVSIGYLTGQKSHNALRWLIAKQGYRNDSECIVCFSNGKAEPPNPCRFSMFGKMKSLPDTKENYARQVNKALAGYRADLEREDASKVAVMAVDTADGAGQGRLAINYYTEMPRDEFFYNIEKWQKECAWKHNYQKNEEGNYVEFVGAPIPKDIILAAYGTERNKLLDLDGKVLKKNIDRILPCIIQGKRFPRDIMLAVVRNASEPQRYSRYNAHKILTIACAVIHKYQCDEKNKGKRKEVYEMALQKENMDRSYLFGRLLAVSDKLEEVVLYKRKEERDTNAKKFWNAFVRKPAKTWAIIRKNLDPYIKQLSGGTKNFYSKIFEEILGKLEDSRGYTNSALNENYLLGYYSQYAALRNDNKKEENDNE